MTWTELTSREAQVAELWSEEAGIAEKIARQIGTSKNAVQQAAYGARRKLGEGSIPRVNAGAIHPRRKRWAELSRQRKDQLRHPGKARARRAVTYALRSGTLLLGPCVDCKAKPEDVKIEACHDNGYEDPFDIVFRCVPCHKAADVTAGRFRLSGPENAWNDAILAAAWDQKPAATLAGTRRAE